MSDLSRLRKQLSGIERSGRRLKAELAEFKADLAADPINFTRSQEQQVRQLDNLIHARRKDWQAVHDRLAAEERRLLTSPDGFLRFT